MIWTLCAFSPKQTNTRNVFGVWTLPPFPTSIMLMVGGVVNGHRGQCPCAIIAFHCNGFLATSSPGVQCMTDSWLQKAL